MEPEVEADREVEEDVVNLVKYMLALAITDDNNNDPPLVLSPEDC